LVIGNDSESMTALAAELGILSNLSTTFLARNSGTHNSSPAKILGRKFYQAIITLVTFAPWTKLEPLTVSRKFGPCEDTVAGLTVLATGRGFGPLDG
jgi:hypothetical protein